MPPILARLLGGAALALVLSACAIGNRLPSPPPDGPIDWEAFDGGRLSLEVAREVNRVRGEEGQPPLSYSPEISKAADEQAVQLMMSNSVGHTNPVPGQATVAERVNALGMRPAAVAENALMEPVADRLHPPCTYREFAAMLVAAWMDSPGHRANLLNPLFTHSGCAARLGHTPRPGANRVYAVQVFTLPEARSATVRQLPGLN